jgi:hypothetical protein
LSLDAQVGALDQRRVERNQGAAAQEHQATGSG